MPTSSPDRPSRRREGGTDWFGSRIETDALGRPEIVTGDYRVSMGGPANWESIEQRIASMDALGVDRQVISLNPILFRYYLDPGDAIECSKAVNDEIAGIVAEHPDTVRRVRDAAHAGSRRRSGGTGAGDVHRRDGRGERRHPRRRAELGRARTSSRCSRPPSNPTPWSLSTRPPPGSRRPSLAITCATSSPTPPRPPIAIGSLIFGGILDRLPGLRLLFAHGGGYACWAYARFDHGHQVRPEAREHIARLPSDYLSTCGTTRWSTDTAICAG